MTHLPLSSDVRVKIAAQLQTVLAATIDINLRTKQAHWNVRGPYFIARHELFDQLAENRREHMDDIAERIGTMGVATAGSLNTATETTPLPRNDHAHLDGSVHLADLAECMGAYVGTVRTALSTVSEHDPISEDLLIEVARTAEQDLWFLESHVRS